VNEREYMDAISANREKEGCQKSMEIKIKVRVRPPPHFFFTVLSPCLSLFPQFSLSLSFFPLSYQKKKNLLVILIIKSFKTVESLKL
jgi:hypothetical protein